MNENKIVHRDLKTNNILIIFDDDYEWDFYLNNLKKYKHELKFKIKLSDYGKSKIGKLKSLTSQVVGTDFYIAPEILELAEEKKEGNKYDYKCDLWSLGIIIYELCFQERPYKGDTETAIISHINSGKNLKKQELNH